MTKDVRVSLRRVSLARMSDDDSAQLQVGGQGVTLRRGGFSHWSSPN